MSAFQPGSHYAFPEPIPEADTASIARKMFDIAYAGRSPAQRLDIYWPDAGNGPFPVIVAIHGGAFMGGDKRDAQLTPMLAGLARGYAVVSINYRMSGEATFPALVHDVKAAIRWMRANAVAFLFDPARIAVWGGSAGGYLALMAGVSANVAALDDPTLGHGDHSCAVQAVVDWFGPTDFLQMDAQLAESGLAPAPAFAHNGANSPESLLLGRQITEAPELVRAANPETYLHGGAPPFFIQHGDRDDIVPSQQSARFAACARLILGREKVHFELLPGAGHADPAFSTPQNIQKVLAFLDQALGA
ncbi:MAG: alpha/beta hydrolase [Caldilinea sp.]|mgnify:CR=1 FL=1|nr:alpha/beta hydrolase [Caldilinea sp.]MCB0066750.1 alpha/beta hydrolase [Caldilineaceae bacterium]MCB0051125.1 alpha/beta hydrolase [Caldilinea sp.]MCB0136324.1 alpha/beta hydrolase [Caldilineaceae bacterium]MCB0147094.1 alpha/beta hydrolase [Caldilineaceae bacterium]